MFIFITIIYLFSLMHFCYILLENLLAKIEKKNCQTILLIASLKILLTSLNSI